MSALFDRFRSHKPFRYSRWDGTQRLDDLDSESVLDALSDDYMKYGDLRQALNRMMQQGFTGRNGEHRMGLRDMMERLKQMRQQQMQRYNLSGVMDDILQKLEHIKQLERDGIQQRLDNANEQRPSSPQSDQDGAPSDGDNQQGQQGQDGQQGQRQPGDAKAGKQSRGQQGQSQPAGQSGAGGESSQQGSSDAPGDLDRDTLRKMLENIANRKLQFLESLPHDPAGQIKSLTDYDFMDDQARQEFQELMQQLQQQIMQQYFQGMQQALSSMTPEDMARMREMVRELNQMLRERAEGNEPDFDSFMQKYGDFFPGVNSLDDLIEQMAQRQAQMQALMESMSPEQRQQLQEMVEGLIGDDRLRVDLAELAMNLEGLSPSNRRTRFPITGDEPVSLAEAMHLMGVLQDMDELENNMRMARRSGDIAGLDPNQLRDLVGEEEAQALDQLQQMMRQLEEDGYIRHNGDRIEMTSRGIRRIGQKALEDIFAHLKRDAFGHHKLPERGYGGERDESTKPYIFGDPFHLNLEQTLRNGINRSGPGTPVRLDRDDFEVYRTEHVTRSSTVVMLDMSWSMLLNELWHPAKKVAIALESLIRGQFPRDDLFLVGFSNMAKEFKAEEIVEIGEWDHVQGTNMVHGLMVARQLLGQSHGTNKQIIMITDGGPSVYRMGNDWIFDWPPPPEAMLQTLREVKRCTRENITINVFMLWDDPTLKHFVNQMATINRGRAFFTSPDDLGKYVLIDYLNNRQKRVS
ncbi:MAG TPA: VWA domain-containing protein [Ktedonobacterales bacterium]|nr:VWA domain-containing protein [Ktedonobacterales bacterium]